jgi:hypothetical protein
MTLASSGKVAENPRPVLPVTFGSEWLCYNRAMMETFLVPEKTVVTAKGDGPSVDVSGAQSRVFLLDWRITSIVEQEGLEISVYGSSDGTNWEAKPLATYPQQFYVGQYPLLLNLSEKPEVKMVRAHWETVRWGRGPETPNFAFQIGMKEVPAETLREAIAG